MELVIHEVFSDPLILLPLSVIAPFLIMVAFHWIEMTSRLRRAHRSNLAAATFAAEQTLIPHCSRIDMSPHFERVADNIIKMPRPIDWDTDPKFMQEIDAAADRAIAKFGLERIDGGNHAS